MKLNNATIAKILGAVTALFLVISLFVMMNITFLEYPFVRMFFPQSEIEIMRIDAERSANYELKRAENMSAEERKAREDELGMSIEEAAKKLRNPSIAGLTQLAKSGQVDDVDTSVVASLKIIKIVLYIYLGTVLLFILLGLFKMEIVFPILAIIFSAPFFIFLVGYLFCILFTALSIAQIVFFFKVKKEAKKATVSKS